jgi:UDP-N-acetylmuramate dehydrogenase
VIWNLEFGILKLDNTIKALLPGVRQNVSLKPYTTFRIGGPAKYFFVAKTKEDVICAVKTARKLHLPFFILGQGSNVLVSDKGFPGLIIKIENCKLKIENSFVYAEAGISFATLVRAVAKRGLAGLEWAGGLPGTLGGAIRGNAGAFGGETRNTIVSVEALDENGRVRKIPFAQCRFGYRNSIFKERGWIVLSAILRLQKGDKKEIQKIARDHIRQRKERGPLEYPNAGSIFKNYNVKFAPPATRKKFQDVIKVDPFPVIPAAALLAAAGLKGARIGGAEISQKHPNFIINRKNAKARDVVRLIALAQKRVQNKFHVKLEPEIQMVGS